MELETIVFDSFRDSIELKGRFIKVYASQIVELSKSIVRRLRDGGGIFFMGNGGSAADSIHLATELVGVFNLRRKPIRALSFASNPALLTEIPNDFGFEHLFERQAETYVEPRDVVIGISTSGKSVNVNRALKAAKRIGALTVGLTGGTGGEMNDTCDVIFRVDSRNVPRIQEVHILIGHVLCHLIEYQMFGSESR